MMSDRCTGKCCKAFPLGYYTKEQIQFLYENTIKPVLPLPPFPEGLNHFSRIEGIEEWWPWMIFIGRFSYHPTTGVESQDGKEHDYFTCSKLLPNGDCSVYEDRPHFCRSYGVEIRCEHPDCEWKSGREAFDEAVRQKEIAEDEFLKEYKELKASGFFDSAETKKVSESNNEDLCSIELAE
jgi:Fe-S-cluster containining protein